MVCIKANTYTSSVSDMATVDFAPGVRGERHSLRNTGMVSHRLAVHIAKDSVTDLKVFSQPRPPSPASHCPTSTPNQGPPNIFNRMVRLVMCVRLCPVL